jgi:uncharacterized membrane protein
LTIAIVLAGCALRLSALGNHSIWYDEGATLCVSTADDPVEALDISRHPPLAFLAFHAWIGWFGQSTAAVRLLTALVSCASLACFARLARLWLAPWAAALAAAFYAAAPFQNWYAQEITPYAFLELGVLWTLVSMAESLARERTTPLDYVRIALGVALAVGSQYLGVGAGVAVAALAAVAAARGGVPVRRAAGWVAAAAAGGLVWVPWVLTKVPRQMGVNPGSYDARTTPRQLLELPVRLILIDTSVIPAALQWTGYVLGGVLWAGVFVFFVRAALRRRVSDLYILTALFTPALVLAALTLFIPPILLPRYLMAAAPGVALAAASGLTNLRPRWLAAPAAAVAVAGLLTLTILHKLENRREDYRAACEEILNAWQPGDLVYVVTGNPDSLAEGALRHYLTRRPVIAASIRHAAEDAPKLATVIHPGTRVHVVYRKRPYAAAHLRAFRDACDVVETGPLRFDVQRLLLVKR